RDDRHQVARNRRCRFRHRNLQRVDPQLLRPEAGADESICARLRAALQGRQGLGSGSVEDAEWSDRALSIDIEDRAVAPCPEGGAPLNMHNVELSTFSSEVRP